MDAVPWRLRRLLGAAGFLVLRLEGEVDLTARAPLEAQLVARSAAAGGRVDVVVDLRGVRLLSSAGTSALTGFADRLADGGHRLLLVAGTGLPHRVLKTAQADDVLEIFPTLDAALSSLLTSRAVAASETPGPGADAAQLRAQIRDLREKLRTRPIVARALGMLQERYGLADMDEASTLLRSASQRYNIRMRELAAVFVAAPAPSSVDGSLWFPGRRRPPPPPVTFGSAPYPDRALLLDLALDAVLSRTAAMAAEVRLRALARGGLVPERQRGLPRAVVERLRGGAGWPAPPVTTVVVPVATDPVFPGEVRDALLALGVRAVWCTPLTAPCGDCVGLVSAFDRRLDPRPDDQLRAELARIGAETGAWLDWYTGTVNLDALEYLHERGRGAARSA